MWSIGAASLLMGVSMFVPNNPEAAKDVLPLATALVGFAGGVVTAIFGTQREGGGAERTTTTTEGMGTAGPQPGLTTDVDE